MKLRDESGLNALIGKIKEFSEVLAILLLGSYARDKALVNEDELCGLEDWTSFFMLETLYKMAA